jgi:hypothetical protein
MDILKGLTLDQQVIVTEELKKIAKTRHFELQVRLKQFPENQELINQTIAWEFVCQNLGIEGFEWS